MIRHSSSFFISIVIHILLVILIITTYKTYYAQKKCTCDKKMCNARLCVNLCALKAKKEIQKPIVKTKKIIKKPKKKKVKKKIKKKKVYKIKKLKPLVVPVVQKIPKPKVVEQSEIVETKQIEQKTEQVTNNVLKPVEKSKEELENERRTKQENATKEYVELNTKEIARMLRENLYYPRSARKRRITGKVMIKFTLKKNSEIKDIVVLKSKSNILSRAAVKTIKSLSSKFPKPQEDIILHIPISYSLK